MDEKTAGRIDCVHCEHFVITWNPRFPRACKLYGFMSAQFPSIEVHKASGEDCMGFVQKTLKKQK